MDSIKAAIEKKRKAADDVASTTKTAGKKYVRRGDIARGGAQDEAKDGAGGVNSDERNDAVGVDVVANTVVESDVGEPPLSVAGTLWKRNSKSIFSRIHFFSFFFFSLFLLFIAAVVRQLRSMGEPATFFAETTWYHPTTD